MMNTLRTHSGRFLTTHLVNKNLISLNPKITGSFIQVSTFFEKGGTEASWPLVSRLSVVGSSHGWGHCVVFLVETLNSHSGSQVHKRIRANLMFGGNPAME